MLTNVTVSGYKSLQESTARLRPFTVIVGRNNVGKSNLFDALRLLSNLAQMPAATAFKPERHRGDPAESFFDKEQPRLRLSCDIDLTGAPNPAGQDLYGPLSCPLLHYDLELGFVNRSMVTLSEMLVGRYLTGGECSLFAPDPKDSNKLLVTEGRIGDGRPFSVPATRSILATLDDAGLYPHIVALATELRSWRFYHFEPDALRESSPAMDILELEQSGRGLSGFYDTLANREKERFALVERALRRGIPEARGIRVLDTGDGRRLLAIVRDDGQPFTARVLSDGTLRFLALLALAYAPQPPGLVCFEEPENGVHPGRLPFIVDTLRGLSQRGSEGGHRSQVLVNSHSPYLVDLLKPEEMLIASLGSKSQTQFASVSEDVLKKHPTLKEILENGEQTLGELWSEGGLDGDA